MARNILSGLLGAPLHGMLRGLRRLVPGLDASEALRRAEAVVDDLRVELGKVIASRHLATKRLAELELRHSMLRHEIEDALDAGRDAEARERVSEELDAETQIDTYRRTLKEANSLERELERALAALLRARREFVASTRDRDGWGEKPGLDGFPGPDRLTHARRVQERLLDIKSGRITHGVETGTSDGERKRE